MVYRMFRERPPGYRFQTENNSAFPWFAAQPKTPQPATAPRGNGSNEYSHVTHPPIKPMYKPSKKKDKGKKK
jgi:hypothetical protein